MSRLALMILAAVALTAGTFATDEPTQPSGDDRFLRMVRPFLARHCLDCHAANKPRANFRADLLTAELVEAADIERWLQVRERLEAGEMPPKDKPRPAAEEVRVVLDWIAAKAAAAQAARNTKGRAVMRRLNRVEYENTLQDLLGIKLDVQSLLPPDSSANGFDNVGAALHTSSFLIEKYLEAADRALDLAIANEPPPKSIKKRYDCKEERHVKHTSERVFRRLDDALVFFSSSPWQGVTLSQFYPPDRGRYRVRISAYAYQSAGKPVTFRVDAGPMLMGTRNHLVGYFDAPADAPKIIEFVDDLEARSTIRLLPYGLSSAQAVDRIGAEKYEGPGLAVQWIELEGPLHDSWPPPSHTRIFGDLPREPVPTQNSRNRVEVVSKNPEAEASRILQAFARRAFRRTVSDEDIQPFLMLVQSRLREKHPFERAVRVGLTAMLVSPRFLFLIEKPGKLDDFALASRLSYFLWSTMPDDELLTLAEQNRLSQPATLRAQVERMLNHPKAAAFSENFVGQWLGLRDIDFTEPSHILYPEFDHMLKVSMVREAELFFAEVLKDDLSLTNFVASEFTMLNGRLAKHYGISGINGWEFRRVTLPPDSHRGGVLTMAAILKVTANGTTTSPVLRGAWVLDRILGTPPPRPPADVPALEPDIRGATTIRDQLAKHRQVASCASCHAIIDPPGFALESFDVIGGWRVYYRTTGRGKPVMADGRRMPYLEGPRVDPADRLSDGRQFKNIDEFKQLLLSDRDQLSRAFCTKLVTYATGAPPQRFDRPEIEALVNKVREQKLGLRSLVHEMVQSKLFLYK